MTTNIKFIKQYKEDLWGVYSFRKKRDKLTTLLDLLKVYRLAPARAYYYKLKFAKKKWRKKKSYKKTLNVSNTLNWQRPFLFQITKVKPRLFLVDDYINDLIKNKTYELLIFFLNIFHRKKYSIINITNTMYLRLQNLYTILFLLTKNTQKQKREFFLRFILNIRSFYPNFREHLNKNKLTLKHIRNNLVKQNKLFQKIEIYNFKYKKETKNIFKTDFNQELFMKYNIYRKKRYEKNDVITPTTKFINDFFKNHIYQLKKLYNNIKQSITKFPFFNFYKHLEYQEFYTKLIININNEINKYIINVKKYFNITIKNDILLFLNPKIKILNTDLKIINKILQNSKYKNLHKDLMKLKYFLITENNLYLKRLFIKNTNKHKKFLLLHLLYKTKPFNLIQVKNNNNKINNILYKNKNKVIKYYKAYKFKINKNKQLENKIKTKLYKNRSLLNYYILNEFIKN